MVAIKVRKFSRSKDKEALPSIQEEVEEISTVEVNESIEIEDDFLEELNNENFVDIKDIENEEKEKEKEEKKNEKIERKTLKEQREQAKLEKDIQKQNAQQLKNNKKQEFEDELYSATPTEILGLDRRALIARIVQTKALFPEKLKAFKIKKNPTLQELQAYVAEADAIISTDCVETFMTDSILQCIKMVEGVSARTRYNVSGMADMLKQNVQFHSLCKQLYLKHKIFSNVPPEYQMLMIMSTTALICQQKNAKRAEIESYLNAPPGLPQVG